MAPSRIGGISFLALLALAAVFLPQSGLLTDPLAQPDGLVLRDLPPLSSMPYLVMSDNAERYVNEWREENDRFISYRRGDRWIRIERAELAGEGRGVWSGESFFMFGTDSYGRCMLSRMVSGARISLLVGLLGALVAIVVGAAVGLASGLGGGGLDSFLMRSTDIAFTVPRLFLALLVVSLYGPSIMTTVLVLGLTTWMPAARLVRGEILSLRERDYVLAAKASGAGPIRRGLFHLLPGASVPLLVEGLLRVGDTVLLESALSFLGCGVPPPHPSWGNLIADGKDRLLDAWWIATIPGLAIAATVIALQIAGDGIRKRLTPG